MSYSSRRSGPPSWFIFLIAIAIVFGIYYVFIEARNFFASGALSPINATQEAELEATATIERRLAQDALPTRRPTTTPPPECQIFVVSVPSAIVRDQPSTAGRLLESIPEGTEVCVIQREGSSDWYLIDRNTITNRIEVGYMRDDLVDPLNPTPTPSDTMPPPPSITPTFTPSITPIPTITPTSQAALTPVPLDVTPQDAPVSS
ncbi:MAG: SH3 domain-containing protein [Anaerolineae bacterium]|nr:SH3 domain-containing protein [Anaerolineae bacterium]MCA9890171.1 SH3 domain-containing protein [Anaerolineae bacterium]MCA9891709.1 SH3 domain-containing protein [Anaerolineae bacterium]MCB9461816.1 SH3 domain-containing protein [Anaerolineaceae bacterium]